MPYYCDNIKILIAYSAESSFVGTTYNFLNSFRALPCKVYYYNVVYQPFDFLKLDDFDIVVLSYCARLIKPGLVSRRFKNRLANYKGIKCIILQDEYENTNCLIKELKKLKEGIIFTCVPEESVSDIYKDLSSYKFKFVRVLTGYASNYPIEQEKLPAIRDRKIVIGYRSRMLSSAYGRLGELKFKIGEEFKLRCNSKGIPIDIESAEEHRLYGNSWIKWLRNVKATLVTESGSNIFDFTGELHEKCSRLESLSKSELLKLKKDLTQKELEVKMGQVSPRVFEALENGCALIGYYGDYGGLLIAGEHYIAVSLDNNNIDSILDNLSDDILEKVWSNAYKDLILSGKYNYYSFTRLFFSVVSAFMDEKNLVSKKPASFIQARLISLLTSCYPKSASRISTQIRFYTLNPRFFFKKIILKLTKA
jgi:hypothetical protein